MFRTSSSWPRPMQVFQRLKYSLENIKHISWSSLSCDRIPSTTQITQHTLLKKIKGKGGGGGCMCALYGSAHRPRGPAPTNSLRDTQWDQSSFTWSSRSGTNKRQCSKTKLKNKVRWSRSCSWVHSERRRTWGETSVYFMSGNSET